MINVERPARRRIGRGFVLMVAVLLAVMTPATPAGAATVVSETTWGGAGSEFTAGVAVAPDGGTYLAGFTTSFSTSERRCSWSRSRRTGR